MSAPLDTVLEIDTPEHLAFKVRLAGPARRAMAWLIDLVVRGVLLGIIVGALYVVLGALGMEGLGMGPSLVLLFVFDWGYFIVWELLTSGQSAGKRVLRMRVVRDQGLPITWRASILRNLLRAGDLAIIPPTYFLPIGPIVMAFDPRFRRLGDMVAGTFVVVEEPTRVDTSPAIEHDEKLLATLPMTLPLDRDDLEALELFVRRQRMSDARREELAHKVAPVWAARLGVPVPRSAAKFLATIWVRAQDPKRRIQR